MTAPIETSNSSKYFKAITLLMWLSVPAMAAVYAVSWGQLPARLATHFDFANQPNGWMSRTGSLIFFLMFTALVAGTATWVLSRVSRPDTTAWVLLIFFYVIIGVLIWAEHAVIAYNVEGRPVNVMPVFGVGMLSAAVLAIIALGTRRGPELAANAIIRREWHGSSAWAGLFGVLTAICIRITALAPNAGLRFAIAIPVLMMLGSTALAWSGFHYLFSPAGVEIRTMGFRLRSIPAAEIQSYAVGRWSWLGGYGIRGVGERRAYVWGNKGVRVKTIGGEVFLGHDQPDQIVRDLDRITHNHEAREAGSSS